MRQRNWTFYKIVLYLGIAGCAGLIALLLYIALNRNGSHIYKTVVWLMLAGACIQSLFYVMCIRFVHHYLSNRLLPGKAFRVLFIVLLIFNGCVAIGSLWLLAIGFSETFLKANSRADYSDYLALTIISVYTFITIYISATSVVLLRYNCYQVATDEESWLKDLGNTSLNQ